ncbi:hypothetical protein QJS04_geneDACA023666 [Acorus gramineus]|uniref:WD repeat-containing protein 75 second beta-propeller domain-containing protein n=1 Tax=Acorus gramineus TaxID=55184 RepID=A0AAV8ZX60_ACOGR|nr:hypothetical protein QJS04_geneDACA023666 [Acorus gramineus]
MVIPSLLQRPLENDDNKKPSNLYAFISIEDKNKPSGDSKALRGQIQMYDLKRSRKVGGLLAEVDMREFSWFGSLTQEREDFCHVSCADNQIHLLKMPMMDITRSISGIKLPCLFPDIYEGLYFGFAFDRAAGLAALRTQSYCIQFFSLYDDREASQVQVLERNYQPGDEITSVVLFYDKHNNDENDSELDFCLLVIVTLVALSSDGSTMSTVEVKLPEEQIGGLVTLKFWASGSRSGEYCLSTVIYEPHSDAGISALAFHPSRSMAVSSSYGGDFKIWVQSSPSSIDQQKDQTLQNSGWKCQSVGSYKGKPMTAAAFSADGSVLAAAAETVVTLWDPDKNILVAVIGETVNL